MCVEQPNRKCYTCNLAAWKQARVIFRHSQIPNPLLIPYYTFSLSLPPQLWHNQNGTVVLYMDQTDNKVRAEGSEYHPIKSISLATEVDLLFGTLALILLLYMQTCVCLFIMVKSNIPHSTHTLALNLGTTLSIFCYHVQ